MHKNQPQSSFMEMLCDDLEFTKAAITHKMADQKTDVSVWFEKQI